MTLGSLSFAAKSWFWPAAILFLASLFFVWHSYPKGGLSPGARLLSMALKLTGLALLLSFLLEPMWTTTRPREGANLFAIVADNSMGLQLRDNGEMKTRGELLRERLTSNQSGWQGKLEDTFLVRRYFFDSRLQSTRDFSELNFDGRETAIRAALKNVQERFQGQPLAGVLLFSDGNATDIEGTALNLSGLPPVYPVLLGKEDSLRDLSLQKVSVSQTVFEDAPVTLTATAKADGFEGEKMKAEVLLNNKTVAQQSYTLRKNNDEVPLRFQLKPEQPGITFYTVKISLENNLNTNRVEATQHNNSRVVAVDRGKGPHRVLYVSGRPNWEYKFLNRAISEDPQVQLVSLIRIARREPKFTFRGRTGESSNPLFRGFNKGDEETARYDQPVLIRLNTKDEMELRDGFPKTPEVLYGYEGIILDDLEADFFTADQMLLMQKYVSERGGGFLMLGGADSLQDGKYGRTPVGDMMPLYLDRLPEIQSNTEFKIDFTREGWLQPWIRLRANEQDEKARLADLPSFLVLNQLKEIKPGATVLATASARNGAKYPGIVMQHFGNGRVAAVAIGDLWMSGLGDEKRQADLQKGWRQIVRWLISDVPSQFELRVEPSSANDLESSVQLTLRARDKKFEPLDNASVQIAVSAPTADGKTNTVTIPAEPSEKEPGLYRASYLPRESGAYVASAAASELSGMKVGEAQAGWVSEPLAKEFQSLVPNRALMEEIARKTGGEMVPLNKLESFVQNLKKKKAPVLQTYSYPLWHQSWTFILALACFISEWGIRRWKGLA
jgi:uncharacterized membrane protein